MIILDPRTAAQIGARWAVHPTSEPGTVTVTVAYHPDFPQQEFLASLCAAIQAPLPAPPAEATPDAPR